MSMPHGNGPVLSSIMPPCCESILLVGCPVYSFNADMSLSLFFLPIPTIINEVSASPSLEPSVAPSPALSSSDFPALSAAEPAARRDLAASTPSTSTPDLDDAAQAKAERKAVKKAAAAERAAERQRVAQEKAAARAAEKERIAQEKAAEKERLAAANAEREQIAKEKAEKERVEREKAAKAKAEREKAEKAKQEQERAAKERFEKEKAEKLQAGQTTKATTVKGTRVYGVSPPAKQTEHDSPPSAISSQPVEKTPKRSQGSKQTSASVIPEPVAQEPILSKMPKKNKPVAKPIRIPKEESLVDSASALPSATTSEAPPSFDGRATESSSNNSRAQSVDYTFAIQPTSLEKLLLELDRECPRLNISKHPFFDLQKINPAAKMPLEYGPLVHALSALSVGGGSFANSMPSGSIDHAVSSFQQLLETLTQTISDLLRLLPRKTWDDNSSFDGVLRDMLKGDDFLDDGGDDQNGHGKEDEVAALTLALERRARWMEVQLSKLEELHRDINIAAVRAVLAFNDNGWDLHGFLPRVGGTLQRFDQIGIVAEEGVMRPMTADELEKKLVVAKEAAVFAEAELRETMQRLQVLKPANQD